MTEFGAVAVPAAVTFGQQRRRREQNRNQVELSSRYQREHAHQKHQEQRYFKIAAQRGGGVLRVRLALDDRWRGHVCIQFNIAARPRFAPRAN